MPINVGTGIDTTVAELAEILIDAVGVDVEPQFNPRDGARHASRCRHHAGPGGPRLRGRDPRPRGHDGARPELLTMSAALPENPYNEHAWIIGSPTIGSGTWVGAFTLIDGSGGLTIGEGCDISSGVHIYTHSSAMRCVSGRRYDTVDREPVAHRRPRLHRGQRRREHGRHHRRRSHRRGRRGRHGRRAVTHRRRRRAGTSGGTGRPVGSAAPADRTARPALISRRRSDDGRLVRDRSISRRRRAAEFFRVSTMLCAGISDRRSASASTVPSISLTKWSSCAASGSCADISSGISMTVCWRYPRPSASAGWSET